MHIQAFGADDSDAGSPKENHVSAKSSNLYVDSQQVRDAASQSVEEQADKKKGNENSSNGIEPSSVSPAGESYKSMGEILSTMDPGHQLPLLGLEPGVGKATNKVAATNNSNSKRSAFWGRSNVSVTIQCFIFLMSLPAFQDFYVCVCARVCVSV